MHLVGARTEPSPFGSHCFMSAVSSIFLVASTYIWKVDGCMHLVHERRELDLLGREHLAQLH